MKEATNEEIMSMPDSLLTGIDKQKRFCLKMALLKSPCPDCKTEQNMIEAARIQINEYSFGHKEHTYTCVNTGCGRTLIQIVPMFSHAPWFWALA